MAAAAVELELDDVVGEGGVRKGRGRAVKKGVLVSNHRKAAAAGAHGVAFTDWSLAYLF